MIKVPVKYTKLEAISKLKHDIQVQTGKEPKTFYVSYESYLDLRRDIEPLLILRHKDNVRGLVISNVEIIPSMHIYNEGKDELRVYVVYEEDV